MEKCSFNQKRKSKPGTDGFKIQEIGAFQDNFGGVIAFPHISAIKKAHNQLNPILMIIG
jgi:hypothetical protein